MVTSRTIRCCYVIVNSSSSSRRGANSISSIPRTPPITSSKSRQNAAGTHHHAVCEACICHSVRKLSDSTAVRSHWSRPHNKYRHSTYSGTDRVRLNFFSKNRINRVLERELEHTITTVECSNEITITITITDKNYDYSNNYEMSYLTIFLFTLTTP